MSKCSEKLVSMSGRLTRCFVSIRDHICVHRVQFLANMLLPRGSKKVAAPWKKRWLPRGETETSHKFIEDVPCI